MPRLSDRHRARLHRSVGLVAALLGVIATLVGHAPAASAARALPPLRLMVAGDSISNEFAGDYTWRYRLHNEFLRQNRPVDFVGPYRGVHGAIPLPMYPWADDQHDALGGTRLAYQVPNIGGDVTTYQPDVMLVMMGFNDLNHHATADAVIENMRAYLANIFAARPSTVVVLSHVLDTVIYPGTTPRSIPIPQVNAGYDQLVQEFSALGDKIVIADQTAPWYPRRYTVDGVHPTPTGEMTIAQRYATSLWKLGMLPQQPHLPLGYVAWTPNARATVVQEPGRVIRFSWDYYKTRLTMYQGELRITGGKLTKPIIAYGYHFASTYQRKLPPGHYLVELAPLRKWLLGRWGRPVSFTVT